ncbi:lipid asymmetry maintenance protein MlaB [Uliginosibacterium sp. sgz301328]|uniref:STAS domain-containing protein n=1 Tax=Uliginosibacterium sp. sgz301328 TaxID=3243764 RepID=UPI00359D98A5
MILERDGVLVIEGAMTTDTANLLLQHGEPLVTAADRTLDLSAVGEVDSSALALVLAYMRAARKAGRRFSVINAPQTFLSLAALYDVSEVLLLPSATVEAGASHAV